MLGSFVVEQFVTTTVAAAALIAFELFLLLSSMTHGLPVMELDEKHDDKSKRDATSKSASRRRK